jgi:putative spermidine/putrescine transport system permease protein
MATSSITVAGGDIETVVGGRATSATPRRRRSWAWVGLLPFFAFLGMFLLVPTVTVLSQALTNNGALDFSAMREAVTGQYQRSFVASIKLSVVTAILGGIIGVMLAYALATLERPKFLRSGAIAFSGVAANLGGLPLAFAFIATLGAQGLATKILKTGGIDLISHGITVYSFWGLVVVYLYFQIPLMVLVTIPAIDGLKPAWREAAQNLGSTSFGYWRRVGIPVLAPSILGGMLLLFANAFSAYATAYVLSTGTSNLVSVQIRFFLQGNTITGKGQLGYALASWMIIIMIVCMGGYLMLRHRAERWRRT